MPIAQLLELWKKIEVEPMETETTEEDLNLDSEPTVEDTAEEGKYETAQPETKSAAAGEVSSLRWHLCLRANFSYVFLKCGT